jgi:2-phospho-L-lactate guanylyltransferase
MAETDRVSIVILCKPLALAKQRLAPRFAPVERAALAEAMLRDVVTAAVDARSAAEVTVQSSDCEVGRIAREMGADWRPEAADQGLNTAAAYALEHARQHGGRRLILLPADLPCARGTDIDRLARLGPAAGVRARDGGTNALLLDPSKPFDFHYGPGSFADHMAEAMRNGSPLRCLFGSRLIDDIDTPAAVGRLVHARPGMATAAFLAGRTILTERVA